MAAYAAMVPGIDVSGWQGPITFGDAQWVAERIGAALGEDSRNGEHRLEIQARGLPRLGYWAAYPGDGAKQAGLLLSFSGNTFGHAFDGREFGVLDQEAKDFYAFLDRNDPLKRDTWQYQDYQHPYVQNGQKHAWRAAWGTAPPAGLVVGDIWQNKASGPGFSGDHDFAIGTAQEWAGVTKVPTTPTTAPGIELGTVNLVHADYFHAVKLHPKAHILTPTGGPRSTASGGEILAWIGSDANYYLVTDGGTLALVLRGEADRFDPTTPIHIAVGN